ncbi:MAG: cytochrome c [bacterium]|nr:cytochrome c [bacterium]
MPRKLLFTILILSASLAWAGPEAEYEKVSFVLPNGDAEAGREAFVALSCTTCHAVEGDTELPRPVASIPVPVLGKEHAKVGPGKIASSIVAPSHIVSEEVQKKTEGELSPMADLTESMTVRQLIDLVAYVRSLDGR